MKLIALILLELIAIQVQAQWPGYYYAFILEDANGNIIDSSDHSYQMEPKAGNDSFEVMLNIEMCDTKTWKYYEGYKDFDKVNYLKIDKTGVKEAMVIEFPPSLSGGKDKYYRNLYLGKIRFIKGVYKVRLPQTDDEWDRLRQMKLCPEPYNGNRITDISDFRIEYILRDSLIFCLVFKSQVFLLSYFYRSDNGLDFIFILIKELFPH